MTTVATLSAVPLVFADAPISTNASILASPARALTVATFLAFAASLTTRLRRQVFLVDPILSLEIDGGRGGRCLAGLGW